MLSDLRQSEGWAEFLTSQGWVVEEIDGAKAYIRKLPFYGSVIKIQRPSVMPPVKTIDKIAQKHRALFVKLEPLALPHRQAGISHKPLAGFEPDKNPNLPTKTIVIDLTKSEEELWRDLSQDARQSIRKAESTSFGVAESSALRRIRPESNQLSVVSYQYGDKEFLEALKAFHQLLKRTGYRQRFWTPNLDQLRSKVGIFGKNSVLFLAYSTKQSRRFSRDPDPRRGGASGPIVGALNLTYDGISYGCYAASSNRGREFHAPYLLIWEIVKRTKSSGLRALDLEGIYDPRYHKFTKRWQGFTVFKRKFGGKEVEYPPPLIKYYHPVAKLLFKLT